MIIYIFYFNGNPFYFAKQETAEAERDRLLRQHGLYSISQIHTAMVVV